LRPILMTTAAMVIGVVPLLMADGAGAKSRFDIGVVIAAGMTIGTLFTLFITPAIYSYVARDRRHMHDAENESDVLGHDHDVVMAAPVNDAVPLPKAAE
jgi:preprotein translocase subunit SecF